ncbi:MAG: tetratricopeptide repeat protein [Planctomycetes bacterium]|nr:tetratricopeptide repeat protein [Planctomycetota bacterium]
MNSRRWVAWSATLAVALQACNNGPRRRDDAVDPSVYSSQEPATQALFQQARDHLAAGDVARGIEVLRRVVAQAPNFVRAHIAWQDAAKRAGGQELQAMVDHYAALSASGSVVAGYMKARLAETPYAQRNALEELLRQDPSFAWAHLSLARVTRRQGRFVPALEAYEAALVHDPSLHEARHERAQVLAELGRDAEAAIDYRAYLAVQPDDTTALRDFVTLLLYRLGRIDEAIELLARLEGRLPGDLSVRMDRAAALWRAKRLEESVGAYLSVLAEAPDSVRAAYNIGLIYYETAATDLPAQRVYWPRARAAFRWFLDNGAGGDGHDQFERTLGVPFRMERIAELLGPEPLRAVRLDDMRWPAKS